MSRIDGLVRELAALDTADRGAFPYADCRKLQAGSERYRSIVPDLDAYLSKLAGYRSWGKRILTWADEKIGDVQSRLGSSFFERCPAYAERSAELTSADVPDLRHALDVAERTRLILLDLLTELKESRTIVTP
jgi:hypothetical protein